MTRGRVGYPKARVLRQDSAMKSMKARVFGARWRALGYTAAISSGVGVWSRSTGRSLELVPPGAGLWRVRDPETGQSQVVDWRSRAVRDAFTVRVAEWRQRTREVLDRAEVDLMDVPVPRIRDRDAVARPILEFFRMRERRGAKR
jgi:hypothetical protein